MEEKRNLFYLPDEGTASSYQQMVVKKLHQPLYNYSKSYIL